MYHVSVYEVCGVWYGLIVYDIIIWCICYGVWYYVYVVVWCVMKSRCWPASWDYISLRIHKITCSDYPWILSLGLHTPHTLLAHQSMQFVNKERYISSVYFHTSVSNTDRQLSLVYISSGIIQFLVDLYDKCNPSCKQATS